MIEVRGISKSFGKRRVLKDVSFSVSKGEVVAFLGPNGAGKTTTMRIITGCLSPDSGEVRVGGFTHDDSRALKKLIGYLPENPPLYGELTVREYLSFVGRLKGMDRSSLKRRIPYISERCGISDLLKRLIKNLSKGQKQRVGIAQAMVHDPEVLILDEPTIGLDPIQIKEIRDLIKELGKEKTVILSTHILQEAEAVCERAIIINKGEIVAQGTRDELNAMARGVSRVFVRFRGDSGVEEAVKSISGVERVSRKDGGIVVETKGDDSVVPEIAKCIVGLGADLFELRPVTMSLEEVFLELAKEEG